MKKTILILFSVLFLNQQVLAVTLFEALTEAYKNNTDLNAERENINISEEDLKISKGNYLPTVTISGSKSQEDTSKLTNRSGVEQSVNDVDPSTQSIKIEQTLIDFGRNADVQKNQIGIKLAVVKLLKKEQEVLLKAIEAYSGLVLANKKLKINQSNLSLIERQVETNKARLERGQITISDLAQSESSLAGAQANFIQSKNEIISSKLNYENVIGPIADINSLNNNFDIKLMLPNDLSDAIDKSKKYNPELIIAKLEYEQSEKDVLISRSDLSPSATLSYENSKSQDLSSSYDERDKNILKATVTWPIYSGGKNRASLNKSRNLQNRKKLLLNSATKANNSNVAISWSTLQSSKSLLNSVNSQVKAAEIANEGITVEYETGLGRSTLDVIQSNSILLSSKISLADSERNYLLSQFKLLQAIGLLNSNYLKIQ
ncbi:TolC family protein [Candidatus Pelagibacter sp.]|jgi:outer membrane protein|nr:TolC family protein [Candidatus Pelagibacter sp.]MDA7732010.1 TolC family protein [Candidatus Pelagibacter sp.]MDC1482822.1 TolC family protein [Pelagibacteraceae bacterium]